MENVSTDKTAYELHYSLHKCDYNLEKFFDRIKLINILKAMNFSFVDDYIAFDESNIDFSVLEEYLSEDSIAVFKEELQDFQKSGIHFPYFKSLLSRLTQLEMNDTISNVTMYNMSFVYLFTLFDEVILKIIRIICMHDKKWLISNSNVSASEILQFETTDELHMLLVDKKINELSWGSYSDKIKFLVDRGITIDSEHQELFHETLLYLAEKRNVLVHNEGLWNAGAKNLLKGTSYYDSIVVDESVERTYYNGSVI